MANHIVLVPPKLLENPPSVREGLSHAVEQQQRIYGCHLIQKAGVLLKLEAVSIASAQTILHRFFFRRSLKHFDIRRVATASLLLACKLEEDPRRVMHLIGVIWLLSQLEDQPKVELKEETLDNFIIDFDSQEYELFRMDVFRCERYILRELGFMVSQTLVHPHRYILQYIHALFKDNFLFTNQLSQKAWGYLNDSMRTTLCCEVQPAVIAVGSIFLAACDLGIPLPRETGWYELFDVSWEDVMKVCSTILSLYTLPLPSYLKLAEETKVLQKAPTGSSNGGAAGSVRNAPSSSSVSSRSRTTQGRAELITQVAAGDHCTNGNEDIKKGEHSRDASSSSSSCTRGPTTSRSSFSGRGDSATDDHSASVAVSVYTGKGLPVSTGMAAADYSRDTLQANKPGRHADGFEHAVAAANAKRSSRDELLAKGAACVSRAQPRAPPPLKERSHVCARPSHETQVVSGKAVSGSPPPSSSIFSGCRNGTSGIGNTSSSRSTTSSSSSSATESSSCGAHSGNSSAGDAPRAAESVSAGRLKYIHFHSTRASSSVDRTERASYSGTAGRRGSPCRKSGREGEQSGPRNSSPSASRSHDRSPDRENWSRGRHTRFDLPSQRNNAGTQGAPSFITAGNFGLERETFAAKKDEKSHSRSTHWSGSISGNSDYRTASGGASRGSLHDGQACESESAGDRSDLPRKGSKNSTASHGATAASAVAQSRDNILSSRRREKDDSDCYQEPSTDVPSPQHMEDPQSQKFRRMSRSGTNAPSLSSTFSASSSGAAAASSSVSTQEGGGIGFQHDRRQRPSASSSRCAESAADVAPGTGDGEKRGLKRQRRPPAH